MVFVRKNLWQNEKKYLPYTVANFGDVYYNKYVRKASIIVIDAVERCNGDTE